MRNAESKMPNAELASPNAGSAALTGIYKQGEELKARLEQQKTAGVKLSWKERLSLVWQELVKICKTLYGTLKEYKPRGYVKQILQKAIINIVDWMLKQDKKKAARIAAGTAAIVLVLIALQFAAHAIRHHRQYRTVTPLVQVVLSQPTAQSTAASMQAAVAQAAAPTPHPPASSPGSSTTAPPAPQPYNKSKEYKQAMQSFNGGDYDTALVWFKKAEAKYGPKPDIYGYMGDCDYFARNFAEAVENYEKYLKYKPDDTIRSVRMEESKSMIVSPPSTEAATPSTTATPDDDPDLRYR